MDQDKHIPQDEDDIELKAIYRFSGPSEEHAKAIWHLCRVLADSATNDPADKYLIEEDLPNTPAGRSAAVAYLLEVARFIMTRDSKAQEMASTDLMAYMGTRSQQLTDLLARYKELSNEKLHPQLITEIGTSQADHTLAELDVLSELTEFVVSLSLEICIPAWTALLLPHKLQVWMEGDFEKYAVEDYTSNEDYHHEIGAALARFLATVVRKRP